MQSSVDKKSLKVTTFLVLEKKSSSKLSTVLSSIKIEHCAPKTSIYPLFDLEGAIVTCFIVYTCVFAASSVPTKISDANSAISD